MKIMILIQARMNSKRFPNKMLHKIGDKTLIEIVYERCKKSNITSSVITSTNNSDKKLVDFCKKKKINFYKSSLNNVYKRFYDAVKHYKLDYFIRITGDSPLVDYKLLKKMTSKSLLLKYDIITNCFPRSYPIGKTIEVFNSNVFLENFKFVKSDFHKEHISQLYYENYKSFKIKNFKLKKNLSNLNLSINYRKDVPKIKKYI